MELSFNVAWGPLSQVAIPLIDVNAAVQLAVGAYGWWKARERSMSLVQMIQGGGGHLAQSITFNLSRYHARRQPHQVRGIAWFDGRLESIPLSSASTGHLGDGGLICLRAVATALLAVYDVQSTASILTRVIPDCLINYDLEDRSMKLDGAFQFAVREFVVAVSKEEQNNTLRKELWEQLDGQIGNMLSTGQVRFHRGLFQEVEVPIVIGLLEWILTSPTKRTIQSYPTRSLTCWSLVVMLSFLGFEIHASTIVIDSVEKYNERFSSRAALSHSEVFLISCQSQKTDPYAPVPGLGPESTHKRTSTIPRVLPIKSIPTIIFRDIRHDETKIDGDKLCAIWEETFSRAITTLTIPRMRYERDQKSQQTVVHLGLLQSSETVLEPDNCSDVYCLWAPLLEKHLSRIKWSPAALDLALEDHCTVMRPYSIPRLNTADPARDIPDEDWHIFTSIILATLYAACCKSLPPCSRASADVDVVVYPDHLSRVQREMRKWISTLRDAFRGSLPLNRWASLHYEMFLAMQIPERINGIGEWRFGHYCHGILVVSDLIVHPSIRPESFLRFHIQFGQPLDIPTHEDGSIQATPSSIRYGNPDAESTRALVLKSRISDTKTRLDLEPDWEGDPRNVIFRLRVNGVLWHSVSPQEVADIFCSAYQGSAYLVGCTCDSPCHETTVTSDDDWVSLNISQLLNHGIEMSHQQMSVAKSVCIHAGGDVGSEILSVISFARTPKVIALECLKCAVSYIANRRKLEGRSSNYVLVDAIGN